MRLGVPQEAAAVRRVPQATGRTRRPWPRRAPLRTGPAASRSPRRSSSLLARCVQIPSISRPAAATSPRNAGRSSGGHTPTRCIPVSTFTCTACAPRAAGREAREPVARVERSGVSRCASATASAPGGNSDSTRIGASIPAVRSSRPSSTSATPHHVAPPSSAAPRDRDRPVAVRVGLDHGHQLGVGWLERGRVVPDRAEVDLYGRRPEARLGHRAAPTRAIASGRRSATSAATVPSPVRSAAASPASPWR